MRVRPRELALWSFLMSSAHGAGLIVAPVLLGGGGGSDAAAGDHAHVELGSVFDVPGAALGLLVHVGTMVAVAGVIALLVYEKLGVEVLRRAWLNTDGLWAAAFVFAGVVTFVS